MDPEATAIFSDIASGDATLLDLRSSTHPNLASSQHDLDLLQLSDAVNDWAPSLTNPHSFQLSWLDIPSHGPSHTSLHPPALAIEPIAAVYVREDDEDSVDDTSPPSTALSDPSQPCHPPAPASALASVSAPAPASASTLVPALQQHTRIAPPISKARARAAAKSAAKAEVVDEARGNVSHTRRCRAKVNNNFERLLHALPSPPDGVEVKHKAQILSYAIDRFRAVRCHNMRLEMQLAMSSPYQMQRWVQSVVSSAETLAEALKPFMALICITRKWKYAELWAPHSGGEKGGLTSLKYITGALPPTVDGEELRRLRQYRTNSRKFVFKPRSGVPGRVFLTMRPEWLPLLNDPVAFPRAPHAVRHKVEVTFAVPVIVNGSVQMVVEFFDTKRRDYDPETMNTANEIAIMFGKAFTGEHGSFGGGVTTAPM